MPHTANIALNSISKFTINQALPTNGNAFLARAQSKKLVRLVIFAERTMIHGVCQGAKANNYKQTDILLHIQPNIQNSQPPLLQQIFQVYCWMRSIKKNKPNIHRFHEAANKSAPFYLPAHTPFTFANNSDYLKISTHTNNDTNIKPNPTFVSVFNFDKIDPAVLKELPHTSTKLSNDDNTIPHVVRNQDSLAHKSSHKQINSNCGQFILDTYYNTSPCEQINFHPNSCKTLLPRQEDGVPISKVFNNLLDKLINQQEQKEQSRIKQQQEKIQITQSQQTQKYLLEPTQKVSKAKLVPYRTEYTVNYETNVVCVNSGDIYSTNFGTFYAGYIDPYSIATLQGLLQFLKNQVCGIVTIQLSSVVVFESEARLQIKIVCYVRPLALAQGLQFTFSSFKQGILKGLRVCNDYVQARWDHEIEINTYDLREEITIKKHSIWLSDSFRRKVHITFRQMQLAQQTKEGFLEFLRKQSPSLELKQAKSVKYESYLNIGMISF